MENTRLSKHFQLDEFINVGKYPDNKPTMQHVANMVYGCVMLLEPARQVVGPIIINSGFRNPRVNALVGGVRNSQHLLGQAADIRPRDPAQFQRLVDFLKTHNLTDQLLTGNGWLHISWNPFTQPATSSGLGTTNSHDTYQVPVIINNYIIIFYTFYRTSLSGIPS